MKFTITRNIRLDVVHAALIRIADHDKKLEVSKLVAIKEMIIENNFSFHFVYSSYKSRFNEEMVVKVIIRPETDRFDFYAVVEENGKIRCRILFYQGLPLDTYFPNFFSYGKCENSEQYVISGKETEIHVFVGKCTVEF